MELFILGSGSTWPDPNRNPSAYAVCAGQSTVLIDAGEGATRAMAGAGIDWQELDAIFLTHYHNDHIAGLIPFLFALFVFPKRLKPLTIYGPPGLMELLDEQRATASDWLDDLPFPLLTQVINDGDFAVLPSGAKGVPIRVEHKDVSLGYRIEYQEKVISFSGDTRMCEGIERIADNADLFVCESGYPDRIEHPNHLNWSQIGKIATRGCVRHLILTHFGEVVADAEITSTLFRHYSGKITLAEDGMTFKTK